MRNSGRGGRRWAAMIATVGTLALWMVAAPAHATTHTVCHFECNFTTIGDAVNAAIAGDTIQVGPGNYAEAVTISKNLTIDAEPGISKTRISGAGSGFTITAGTVTIRDFNIQGTTVGVNVTGGTATLTLTANTFASNGTHVTGLTASQVDAVLASGANNVFTGGGAALKPDTGSTGGIYPTVAQAVTAGDAGDTVEVLTGSYTENLSIDDDITVTSRGTAAATTITGTATITGTGDGATLDDLTITGTVTVATGADNAQLSGNEFATSVAVAAGSMNVDVTNNDFNGAGPVALSHAASASEISDNDFGPVGTSVLGAVSTDAAIDLFGGSTLVNNNRLDGAAVGTSADPAAAIRLNNTADGAIISGHADIRNNDIGVLIGNGVSGAHLEENTIVDNTLVGVDIDLSAGDDNGGHDNSISSNGGAAPTNLGVRNRSAFIADFSHNWWGHASGPTHANNPATELGVTGDRVDGDVDWLTWCVADGCPDKPVQDKLPF